jgi:hypothetical protein
MLHSRGDFVDVFGAALEARGFLCDAAIAGAHDLGVFAALARGPASLDRLAGEIGIVAGRRRYRLRALLDVLAALGAIERAASSNTEDAAAPRFMAAAATPACPVVARAGWGVLAEVIRDDRPLPQSLDAGGAPDGGVAGTDGLRRVHHHLATAGADAARELIAGVDIASANASASVSAGPSLLDLGSGAGAYSRAFLDAHPEGRATLVDTASVLALAAEWLGPQADRARLVAGDASTVDAGGGHGIALLANLLHLHSPDTCSRLVAAAARAVAPGGAVVIKDLRVDDDRSGPIEGLLFALNMALYTEAGDVYSTSQLRGWLAAAGLVEIEEHRLAAALDAVVVVGRRPIEPSSRGGA